MGNGSRFHVEADSYADFLQQVGQQLKETGKSEAQYQIKADTVVDFLKQVGDVVSKVSVPSFIDELNRENEANESEAEKDAFFEKVYDRVDEFSAEAEILAEKLFFSTVVLNWDYHGADADNISPYMTDIIRLIFAKDVRKIRLGFGDFSKWSGNCPFDNKELRRIIQWLKEIHGYSDLEKIYHREQASLTERESEILLNMAYYELARRRDKDIQKRFEFIDQRVEKKNFFSTLMRRVGFSEYPDLMLQILVEGEFRNIQDILLNSPGQMIYLPSHKQGLVVECGRDIWPLQDPWVSGDSLDDAVQAVATTMQTVLSGALAESEE